MQYIYKLLLLLTIITSCQTPTPKKINLEDIQDSSNRAYPVQEESDVVFYNTEKQIISSDRFNQYLAEGLYLSESKTNLYGQEEIHLVSLIDYTHQLEQKSIPHFEFNDLNGKTYTSNNLKGKVTVLSFWFTASNLCVQEIEEINNLSKKIKSPKVQWLALALDKTPELSHFLKSTDWDCTFIANQEELALKLGILTYPTHLIVNDGKIHRAVVRHHNVAIAIEDIIKPLL